MSECSRHAGEPEPCGHCALDAAADNCAACHCGRPIHVYDEPGMEGFSRGLCLECSTVRCDVAPGPCATVARRSRRGTETRRRTRLVNLRLTAAEDVDLRARAAAEDLPVATYIRKRVFATTDDAPAWVHLTEEQRQVLRAQVARIVTASQSNPT